MAQTNRETLDPNQHQIVHVEIPGSDQAATVQFYEGLFGWDVTRIPQMEYAVYNAPEGRPRIGFPTAEGQYQAGNILIHVSTPDVPASLKRAEELGATVVYPLEEIPTVGHVAWIRDPAGNVISLYSPGTDAVSRQRAQQP